MRNAVKTRSVLTAILLSVAAFAGPEVAAGVVTLDQPALNPSWETDLTQLAPGVSVSGLGFAPLTLSELASLSANVTTDSVTNEVTTEGWWRLKGTTTTLAFDHTLSSLWFEYAHERTATVEVAFLDAAGVSLDAVTLDGRATPSGTVSYTADDGQSFDSVRLTWTRAAGHAVQLGPTFSADPALSVVPGPGAGVLAPVCLGLASGRRRG